MSIEPDKIEIINRRNKRLVYLISQLDLGIHILNLPEKPLFYNKDYSFQYSGYVKNFDLILNTAPHNSEPTFTMKLMNNYTEETIEQVKYIFQDWINNCTHLPCHVIKVKGLRLYLTGFNHHDKLNKVGAYPVFSEFCPHIYFDLEKKKEILNKFNGKLELE